MFTLFVPSVGAPLSVGGPEASLLLAGMFSSTTYATNPSSSIARFAMVQMSCLKATGSVAKASVREFSPCCVHRETSVTL